MARAAPPTGETGGAPGERGCATGWLGLGLGLGLGVFPERYHAVRLRTAKQVRAALCYVLQNARRHGLDVPAGAPDVFSSAWWFTGWTHERWRAAWKPPEAPTVAAAEGWLLTAGWRRWGLIGVEEVPPAARNAA